MPILVILQAVAKIAWGAANTTVARAIMLAALAYGWGHHRASAAYEARIATERAALKAAQAKELAREQDAARAIARDATERATSDALEARALQAKIDDLRAKDNFYVPLAAAFSSHRDRRIAPASHSCVIDDGFARVLRDFDSAAHPKAKSARSAK